MNNLLFDLSGKIDRQTIDALAAVKRIADSLNIRFFIVGATARDLILKYCYGIESSRRTEDIDLGVEIANWDEFSHLTTALMKTGEFSPTKEKHRFLFGHVRIDIIPFGPITDEHMRISWPPEHEIIMNMAGFEEVYENSTTIRLSSAPELDIKLPTLPGLAILKIISWEQRYPVRKKDAEDLLFILRKYEDAGNTERLYGKELNLLIEESFDTTNAGARLLGRDMANIANSGTLNALRRILENETWDQGQFKLVMDMVRGTQSIGDHFDKALLLVEKLKKGLIEGAP